MIVIHIDTQHDTSLMDALYMELDEEIRLLYNPTRELIDEVLEDNPTESLMCVGHGTEDGLLGYLGGYAIDEQSVPLLKTREVIGFVAYNYGISCPQENDIMYFDGTQGK